MTTKNTEKIISEKDGCALLGKLIHNLYLFFLNVENEEHPYQGALDYIDVIHSTINYLHELYPEFGSFKNLDEVYTEELINAFLKSKDQSVIMDFGAES